MKVGLRKDTLEHWTSHNPRLALGEVAVVYLQAPEQYVVIGDGYSNINDLEKTMPKGALGGLNGYVLEKGEYALSRNGVVIGDGKTPANLLPLYDKELISFILNWENKLRRW